MAQNEMTAMRGLPVRVRLSERLGSHLLRNGSGVAFCGAEPADEELTNCMATSVR
jgi:hypothetical protein